MDNLDKQLLLLFEESDNNPKLNLLKEINNSFIY